MTHDVLIIGGGVSGMLAAGFLRDLGVDVAVVPQTLDPSRDRSFLGLMSAADLALAGVSGEAVPEATMIERHEVVQEDHIRASTFQEPVLAIEHGALLAALRDRAERLGALVYPAARHVTLRDARGLVAGASLDVTDVDARLVVLADEADPRIAESIGLRRDWPPDQLMHIAKIRVPRVSMSTRAVAWSGTGSWGQAGWGLAIETGASLNLAMSMTLEDAMRSKRHISEMLGEFARDPRIVGSDAVDIDDFRTEVVPIGGWRRVPTLAVDGALVIGDLAGLTTPLLRDGLSFNVHLAHEVADVVRDALRSGDLSAACLSLYAERVEQAIGTRGRGRDGRSWLAADHGRRMGWAEVDGMMTNEEKSANLPGKVVRQTRGIGRHIRRTIGR